MAGPSASTPLPVGEGIVFVWLTVVCAIAAGLLTAKMFNVRNTWAQRVERLETSVRQNEQQIREKEAAADDLPRVKIVTDAGDIVIELYENEAPNTVANFISLVEKKFYDGTSFHRVLPNFMAQGGDPKGDGSGGPGYTIACECYRDDARMHFADTLSMAHAGKDTGGSQFFLTFRRTPHLDGKHTVFGKVTSGQDIVDSVQQGDQVKNVTIEEK